MSEKKRFPTGHLAFSPEGRRLFDSKRLRVNVKEGDDKDSLRRDIIDAISRAEVMISEEERREFDPRRIADSANGFFLASQRAFEPRPLPGGAKQILAIPGITCLAFAGELYLKSILTIEGSRASSHELTELFERLSHSTQEDIRARLTLSEESMEAKLVGASDAFTTWRYVYEARAPEINLAFLRGFVDALRAISERLLALAPKGVRPEPTEEDILRFVASWQKNRS
jgi:HEPN domain-containing protein